MTEQQPRRREGLEGLPVNASEAWGFDAVRAAATSNSDTAAFVVCWLAVVGTLAVAIWGASIILGIVGALGLVLVGFWTAGKLRSRADTRRMRRHVLAEEAAEAED